MSPPTDDAGTDADGTTDADGATDADDATRGGLSPVEAFSILGNELRLSVLRALWEADGGPLTYSELRRAVEYDVAGNFNYHLDRLTGQFVRKTDDGYELRYAGAQVMRAMLAGTITDDTDVGPETVDDPCPFCGAPVTVAYSEETLSVRCTECPGAVSASEFPSGTFMQYGFPPAGLVDRSLPEVIDAAHTFYDSKLTPMIDGVCPECAGRVALDVDVCEDHDAGDGTCPDCGTRWAVWATYTCERCQYRRRSAAFFQVLAHPAAVAFAHEHVGLEETVPFRKLTADNAAIVQGVTESVRSHDPLRIRVTIAVESASLHVDLDGALSVERVEVRDGGDVSGELQ